MPHLVCFAGEKLTLKQTKAGGLLIGGGWPARRDGNGRPVVDCGNLRRNLAVAAKVLPAARGARLLRAWPGVVNANADWKPVPGAVPDQGDLYFCCFPWMGFTAAPICARLTAQAMTGEPTELDIAAFGIDRHAGAARTIAGPVPAR